MKHERLQHQQAHQAQDGVSSELKAMVQTLMGRVKGKGKASDHTPRASGAGGRNPETTATEKGSWGSWRRRSPR